MDMSLRFVRLLRANESRQREPILTESEARAKLYGPGSARNVERCSSEKRRPKAVAAELRR